MSSCRHCELGPLGPDPGERRIHAHVHARRSKLDELATKLDRQLQQQGVFPHSDHERKALQLLGDLQHDQFRPGPGPGASAQQFGLGS